MERLGSRFRGVSLMSGGRWGAHVDAYGTTFGLGAYNREEDAAIAYDRARLKLDRHTLLNLPLSIRRVDEEVRFQSRYSFEYIVSMINSKTYEREYIHFLARGALMAKVKDDASEGSQQISTDVGSGSAPEAATS